MADLIRKMIFPVILCIVGLASCTQDGDPGFTDSGSVEIQTRAWMEVPPDYRTVPLDVTDILDVTALFPGDAYAICGNYARPLPFCYYEYGTGGRIVIYMVGVWEVQEWNLGTGIDIIVMPGGVMNCRINSSFVVNGDSNIFILDGGTANFTNDFFYFSNSGSLYVGGDLKASCLSMNSGTFYIAPIGYARIGQLTVNTGTVINEGTLIIEDPGWDEEIGVYTYQLTYVPGVSLYVLDTSNPTECSYVVSDNQGYGTTLTTDDFNPVRLYLPVDLYLTPAELPLTLTYDIRGYQILIESVEVTFH